MGKKKADEHKTHDESIRKLVDELKKEKWEVKANVEGTEKPPKIGIFTPDILATKGDLKRICQVLTEKTSAGINSGILSLRHTATSMISTSML